MSFGVLRKISILGALIGTVAAGVTNAQFRTEASEFLEAVEDRDGNAVTAILDEPGNTIVNSRDLTSGETALHIVTKRRDELWIRFLTQRGANPNIKDRKGIAPIQIAVTLGFVEGVETLIKAGADVEVSDSTGETPLIAAVHQRNIPLIRLLLENKANPDRADNSGRTARDYATLLVSNSAVLTEFERADKAREDSGSGESYGPSF